ncbi:MAG: UMP kinase [Candidatus Woesearchaeota archaeon]
MRVKNNKIIIISLGGSVINKKKINIDFIKDFKRVLESFKNTKFIIVCGGGFIARNYQNALKEFSKKDNDLDEIGIKATEINALLISKVFNAKIIKLEDFEKSKTQQFSKNNFLVSHGNVPGHTTDFIAVSFAKLLRQKFIINISRIKYVRNKENKRLKRISWNEYLKIIPKKHKPGLNIPFDIEASKLGAKNKIGVVFVNNISDLKKVLNLMNEEYDKKILIKLNNNYNGTIIF